jgi:small subunit ribosomal protein S19e
MTTLYDVPAEALIEALAERLDERLEEPEWAAYVKTGANRELPPEQEGFWSLRAASLLRRVAVDGPIGVERLSTHYGGAKDGSTRYRVAPARHADGSSNIIRTILQQLQEEGLVDEHGSEGREVTGEGRALLDEVADEVLSGLVDEHPELERYA